ncbi:MAG: succinylglutamate desuccinylase/aspartoacylase family protein [Desulfobacteraceae bacterium]|nr:succinylglutamate desuccinylase/aspartoacylase family protein [Desulfobacteraceae bacterium]
MKKKVRYKIFICLCVFYLVSIASLCAFAQKRSFTVFFEGEDNELYVYKVNGTDPGKTLMIIGGIQGDEVAGFLAADRYADISLKKGNLIVVPRANFPSILKRERKINEDMNRKFSGADAGNYETKVVKVLKKLIQESDCLLNLHEGSGIFSEKWEGPMRNPKRFGQSIIADTAFFEDKKLGIKIDLEAMANNVIKEVNKHITNSEYFFHFNNHGTAQSDTKHKEQRGSATYYALYQCKIPAFGVESAKTLPLEQKVKQHIYAINGFMNLMGVIPETPGIDLKKPELQYIIISVNDSVPVVVGTMQRLKINRGDIVEVLDIVANYKRGLSVDIIGVGSDYNDMKKKFVINEETRIIAKKDCYACGSIFLDFHPKDVVETSKLSVSDSKKTAELKYKLKVNGRIRIVDNYSHVKLKRGDKLVILDLISGNIDPSEYVVNFKGFVGNRRNNTGEDRGYLVDTAKNVLMRKYSINKQNKHYYIVTSLNDKEVGKLFIDF